MRTKPVLIAIIAACLLVANQRLGFAQTTDQWRVGFAKVDVTPAEPLRLSGYANRAKPYTAVSDPLHVRAMTITREGASQASSLIIVSLDAIAVSASLTNEVAAWANEKYSVTRGQIVLCSSHSHAAPQIAGALNNIYTTPLTEEEATGIKNYTDSLIAKVKQAIEAAFAAAQPVKLSVATSSANFAIQRRTIREGKWAGFGETPDGACDRRVHVLQCRSLDDKILGGTFMYACHCTTMGGEFNQLSGDWAGLSASRLEQLHPQAVFLPIIGCGADANPSPRGSYELAQKHAAEMVDSVQKAFASEQSPLTAAPEVHFGHAGLAPEIPDDAKIEKRATSNVPTQVRWAEKMKATRTAMGRLPESVPMPIHTWRFGDQLTWVFLGGEVVSEYQMAIEKRLGGRTWVAAYVDDVFAYVASERMYAEGGYEVDDSMIYYLQPGRWQSGTQELIERRVEELLKETQAEGVPLSAADTLKSIRVPEGFQVELVAAEPLVADPVNIAFAPDGSVWVVEMGDYPLGNGTGGRVKRLMDTDADGKLDSSQLFLEGLSYPSSVMPWRDGAIVISAPDVLFARDTNGDGVADEREVLLTGIAEANPQHRASGFAVGIDGWLHFTSGDSTKEIKSTRNNKTYSVQHHDLAWHPDSGEIRVTSGDTQFMRARDDFGNWFGNSNSFPMYQFVIDSRYQTVASVAGDSKQHLLTPPAAPPVYPRGRTVDRFNDLYALNRFTSACSSMIVRSPGLGDDMYGAALVCEPVHNLVARFRVKAADSSFVGERFEEDKAYDFFTSTDPFCRPVRAVNAPDGSVWIVDMYRQVIEHPEWIPTAWQERINVRSGEKLGRIYRVSHVEYEAKRNELSQLPKTNDGLSLQLAQLASDVGAQRELGQLELMWSYSELEPQRKEQLQAALRELLKATNPAVRVSALGCMKSLELLQPAELVAALNDQDSRVVRAAIELSEPFLASSKEFRDEVIAVADRSKDPHVDLQWLLTVLTFAPEDCAEKLSAVAARSVDDVWIVRSLALCQDARLAKQLSLGLLKAADAPSGLSNRIFADVQQSVGRLWSRLSEDAQVELLNARFQPSPTDSAAALTPSQLLLIMAYSGSKRESKNEKPNALADDVVRRVTENSLARMMSGDVDEAERLALINLLGCELVSESKTLEALSSLIDARQPPAVQEAALLAARRIKSPAVSGLLISAWPKLTAESRAVAGAGLLTRKSSVMKLVEALEQGSIKPTDLDVATMQQLKSYGDRAVRNRCELVFGKQTARASVVAEYLRSMPKESASAVETGKQLFAENCAVCHRPAAGKPMVGPSVDNLGHWTVEQWVTAIMDPNRAIEPKFHQYSVLTVDGQVLAGVILQRTAQSVRLVAADGSEREVLLADVEEIRDTGVSLMPEGLETKLTPEKLSALIQFLRSR